MQKIRTKLVVILLLVSLIPMLAIGLFSINIAQDSIETLTFKKLESVRDVKKSTLESYFTQLENQIEVLASNKALIEALDEFSTEYLSFGDSSDGMDVASSDTLEPLRQSVKSYWQKEFAPRYQAESGETFPLNNLALSDQAYRLQDAFMIKNEHPVGQKNKLNMTPEEGRYGYNLEHLNIHPWFNLQLEKFGFYDIFLIDQDGNVVYSAFKEVDFATNLETGPWKNSGLAQAYQQAKELKKGQVTFTDLAPYQPSYNAPASFAAVPVFKTKRKKVRRLGTLIIQMPLDRISNIMKEKGSLGASGTTFLVGSDGLMRSDYHLNLDRYSVKSSFKNPNQGKMTASTITAALTGTRGTEVIERNGDLVLSTYDSVMLGGHRWALLAEVNKEEALAPLARLEQFVWTALVVAMVLIGLIALTLANRISKPIVALTDKMHQIQRSFQLGDRVAITGKKDEIAQAGAALNELLDSTQHAITEVNQAMQSIAEGDFSRRITSDLKGDLADLKHNVNASAQSVDQTMDALDQVMCAIIKGNFKLRLEQSNINSDFKNNVNQAMQTLELTMQELSDLLSALSHGKFDQRVTSDLKGDLLVLKQNANTSLERLQLAFSALSKVVLAQSQGDLTQQVSENMEGELHSLKDAVNQTSVELNQVIRQVVEAANHVSGSSQEVYQSSQDLNERTQEQARSLEDTAQNIESLTQVIRQNTETAKHADQVSQQASSQAKSGRQVMQETEQAIADIHASSKQIEEITSLIDGIAFQTNLLALNAAVEAARAGEAGRGFAVVAGEVRSLAQKSAEAAKQIRTLIETTVGNIENGTRKIEASAGALDKIHGSIDQMTDLVSQIAQASVKQQQDIERVEQVIHQVDQGTQQNTALVEETSKAAESMTQESHELQNTVSRFKT